MRVWIGWDANQMRACNVAEASLLRHVRVRADVDVQALSLSPLVRRGIYRRSTQYPSSTGAGYWDDISGAPMSTGHAIARFLVPALCDHEGWALFTDGDVLFRRDVAELFALADPTKAIQVVPHDYHPVNAVKMEGQSQTRYPRKNWSSVILWNCAHPAHRALTDDDLVNTLPGRDLHRFCWVTDAEIGSLPGAWNWLVGHSDPAVDPAIVHFTEGLPDMPGYEHVAYADEWYELARACGYRLERPEKVVA